MLEHQSHTPGVSTHKAKRSHTTCSHSTYRSNEDGSRCEHESMVPLSRHDTFTSALPKAGLGIPLSSNIKSNTKMAMLSGMALSCPPPLL